MRPTAPGYVVTTSLEEMTMEAACSLVRMTDWHATIPAEVFAAACEHSLCVGALAPAPLAGWPHRLVGFARVVTDRATYGYLCDVIVHPDARGLGLSHALVDAVVDHPSLAGLRRLALLTRHAAGLYRQHGFVDADAAVTYLERRRAVFGRVDA